MNSSNSFKNISNRTIMPEYRQFYDDEIQGQSISQGNSKDSIGISTSIWLLLLNCVSIADTVMKKCGDIFSCVWFDWCMALPVYKVWHGYTQLQDNCSVPAVWCCCQQAKTDNSCRYEVTSSYGDQLLATGILGFLEKGEGTIFV